MLICAKRLVGISCEIQLMATAKNQKLLTCYIFNHNILNRIFIGIKLCEILPIAQQKIRQLIDFKYGPDSMT